MAPLFLTGPGAAPHFSIQAQTLQPMAAAARSPILKIALTGDEAMARLDQEQKDELGDRQYAFPKERKEPLENASHVRNAVARFNQVKGVSDSERDEAWDRIQAAARKYGVELEERSWRELHKPKG